MKNSKKALLLLLSVTGVVLLAAKKKGIYAFKIKTITGKSIDFSKFKGKKILIVNTASECGFTPQYADLEKLHQEYKDRLEIVAFPTNDFGNQDPGSNEQIAAFCENNYKISFPISEKISVKGISESPIFKFLTQKKLNGVKDTKIKWNFTKFLLDEKGKLIDSFPSEVRPIDREIINLL